MVKQVLRSAEKSQNRSPSLRPPSYPSGTGKKKVYTTTVETLLCCFSGSEAPMVYSLLSEPMVYTVFLSQENGIHHSFVLLCDLGVGRPKKEGCHGGVCSFFLVEVKGFETTRFGKSQIPASRGCPVQRSESQLSRECRLDALDAFHALLCCVLLEDVLSASRCGGELCTQSWQAVV